MSTRLALPTRRNHITQKVKIAASARFTLASMTTHDRQKSFCA